MKRTLRNDTVKSALRNFIVPCVSNKCHVIAFRALWDLTEDSKQKAELNIWRKRNQLDSILKDIQEIVVFISCLTAMDSSDLRRKHLSHKRRVVDDRRISGSDTDNDYDSYTDNGIIPGRSF